MGSGDGLKVVAEDSESITIDLQETPHSVANALRRIILREVPTMAVEEVLIIENSSSLTNEVLAHRISLIPFITDLENYRLPEECDCQSRLGCDKCVVRFVLKGEASDSKLTLYSRDIKPEKEGEKVAPFNGDIPIVALAPGQRVELELYVRLGKGKRHSKWTPGVATLYREEGKNYLYVESFGFLNPLEILKKAVKIVKNEVASIQKAFEEMTGDAGR
ncbi:MAG: DNA-directed RNA polymerase subunit D [Candidatus Caldarchaeum sp.]|nr:DNA-directed RNA polymerase subunit D [Candidatus Caldarchaeum sp.]